MLMLVGEALGKTRIIATVARELSLSLNYFKDGTTLADALRPATRRMAFLTEVDLRPDILDVLVEHRDESLSLLISADEAALRSSDQAELIARLDGFDVHWLGHDYDVAAVCDAARACRRKMLRVSKEELEQAIWDREFVIQYQPKVERGPGDEWLTHEAEALLRWKHPQHGLLGPLEFLPELEAFELMAPVSELVLHEAAQQLLKWRERGWISIPASISHPAC